MDAPATPKKTLGTTDPFLRIVPSSGTSRVPINSAMKASSIAVPTSVVVAEVEALIEDTYIRAYHALVPKRTMEEEEAEEREWDEIVSKPNVRNALRRMATEARRQYYAGKTEEGGFELE